MNDKEMITAMENLALPDITQNTGQDMKEGLGKDVIGQAVDLLGDNIEIGLDMTIDNELLKEIPIIGNFVKNIKKTETAKFIISAVSVNAGNSMTINSF